MATDSLDPITPGDSRPRETHHHPGPRERLHRRRRPLPNRRRHPAADRPPRRRVADDRSRRTASPGPASSTKRQNATLPGSAARLSQARARRTAGPASPADAGTSESPCAMSSSRPDSALMPRPAAAAGRGPRRRRRPRAPSGRPGRPGSTPPGGQRLSRTGPPPPEGSPGTPRRWRTVGRSQRAPVCWASDGPPGGAQGLGKVAFWGVTCAWADSDHGVRAGTSSCRRMRVLKPSRP